VLVNNADATVDISVPLAGFEGKGFRDLLTPGEAFWTDAHANLTVRLYPKSGRILRRD